jgi:hypothetical protein
MSKGELLAIAALIVALLSLVITVPYTLMVAIVLLAIARLVP